MNEEKAKKIFEKYNRKADVVRCPNGRAVVRKQLDSYVKAAVNLYGIISRDDLIGIFNQQNVDQTNYEEIYILLLPLVLKEGWYGFYKEYIVHYFFLEDFDQADALLKEQADKPRYIPEKNEFLKYVSEDYEDNDHWWNVLGFMGDVLGPNRHTFEACIEVKNCLIYGDGIRELGPILDKYNLVFSDEEQFQEFINLTMTAKNNTRIWENKGYAPLELHEIYRKQNQNVIPFPTLKKTNIGRNDPCPCGSGKKYKKCCALIDDNQTAQLSSEECRLFYETWFGLMSFVNERKQVLNEKIKPEYPNKVSDIRIYKVRDALWENPELIDEYISETELPKEKTDILKLWRTNHKKGMFIIFQYQPEYAVAISSNEQGEDRLYGIKGISNSLSYALHRDLPQIIETVLLPFKGKIIYDSFMSSMPISYGEGTKKMFGEMYDKAIKHGIITSLD